MELIGEAVVAAARLILSGDAELRRIAALSLAVSGRATLLVAIAAGFGRAVAEVGASLMVGGNILGQTRILTTAIALEAGKGEFALALALGFILLALAFLVNAALGWAQRAPSA